MTEQLPSFIAQDDWNAARRYIELPTGLTMSYVEMGNANGPTLLLQHGMNDNSRSWSLAAPYFCEAGYHVFMCDLRGHGFSDQPDGFYTIFDYASDLKAFLDVKGIEQAYLVGHSLGSLTMQAFMLMFPEKCRKVVLVASAMLTTKAHKPDIFQYMKTLGPDGHPSNEFIEKWYVNPNPIPEDFIGYMKKEAQQLSGKSWTNVFGGACVVTLESMYPLFDTSIPVFQVGGTADTLIPLDAQKRLHEALPFADYKEYEGIGHNLQFEIPEQLARDIIDWFQRA